MSIKWDSKGLITLWSGQGLKALAGCDSVPQTAAGRSAKGELKTVFKTVFKRERPASEGVP